MRRLALTYGVVPVALLALAGCAGSEEPQAEAEQTPTASTPAPGPLPDGVYRTSVLPRAALLAAAEAAGYAEADAAPLIDYISRDVVYEVAVTNGAMKGRESVDGGPPGEVLAGGLEIDEDGTVRLADACGDTILRVAERPEGLGFEVLGDECHEPVDVIYITMFFESGPFAVEAAPGQSPTAAAGEQSVSTFVAPFTITLADWLDPAPVAETGHFVTWESPDTQRALRVLSPVSLYRPGAAEASEVPADYPAYLRSLTDAGAEVVDVTETEVDGRPAIEATVGLAPGTEPGSLDGALGCQEPDLAATDCYGPQADLLLRLVYVDVDGVPVLVWERAARAAGPLDATSFDAMVSSLDFS